MRDSRRAEIAGFNSRSSSGSASFDVSFNQPLIDLSVFPAIRGGQVSKVVARLQHQFTMRGTLFGVTEAYYEVLKQQQLVEVNREALRLAGRAVQLRQSPRRCRAKSCAPMCFARPARSKKPGVFSDKLVSVCTALSRYDEAHDPLREEPWQHVESSIAALQQGIAELRGMQTAIEQHTREQLAATTLKEYLALLFDHFAERIGHACYAELVRARLPLRLGEARRRVEELEYDAELLTKMQAEVLRREPALSPETAMSRVRLRLEELSDLLQSVVPVADAVDRRTAEFTRRSLARFRYLQETTSENRAHVQEFFETLNRHFAGRRVAELESSRLGVSGPAAA